MAKPVHINAADAESRTKQQHGAYAYTRCDLVPRDATANCALRMYELKPGMSAYPYHYHLKNEEIFFILRGVGVLRTPEGERTVAPGDCFYFPADERGAHKLTNTSPDAALVYLDFGVCHDLDVALYPDSGKIGVWGKDVNQLFETKNDVDYYKGE
ncbi:MAG: cupin domain-containing protein [Christensenellales bacterium]|jgi:uncharacterized cupin superfamily protein